MKQEWRKSEKDVYLPKTVPALISIPEYNFITLAGEGNPNSKVFPTYIEALYAVAYAVKMNLKKINPDNDFTVYPLEGVWDIREEARKDFKGILNKDDLVFTLMIRQPDFVEESFVYEMIEQAKVKKQLPLLDQIKFERINGGQCVQMMHIGSFDEEPKSFAIMEAFAEKHHLLRTSKKHREIYLSDFRKVPEAKLKTVLRFNVRPK